MKLIVFHACKHARRGNEIWRNMKRITDCASHYFAPRWSKMNLIRIYERIIINKIGAESAYGSFSMYGKNYRSYIHLT